MINFSYIPAIYGIWFYDKDECARIGQLMNSLLQLAIENHRAKSNNAQRQRRASESDTMQDRVEVIGPESKGIDIVQMLYQAQHEYDKTKGSGSSRKKVEPKPLIDNPNAAATKSSTLIRPMPLKMGGHSESPEDEVAESIANPATPTAPISLETLFRNASMRQQQGGGINFPPPALPDTSKPPPPVTRTMSMSDAEKLKPDVRGGDLPILLKQLMGSGSMVEDIERRHRGEVPPPQSVAMPTIPIQPIKNKQKSPTERLSPHTENVAREDSLLIKFSPKTDLSQSHSSNELLDLSSFPAEPNQGHSPVSVFPVQKPVSPNTAQAKPSSVPKENLLTPAKLDQGSSQSMGSSTLAAAAASLGSDVLLSPMAFVRSSRKSPPLHSVQLEPVLNLADKSFEKTKETDSLPVAALTKDQLQQALLYLVKNDSSFIDTLHEAYLKSLKDLAGPRS
ncbi:hypothetical protein ScPMuIL_008770 [Solemya velum]